jgi:acyl carrier protein
MEAPAPAPTNQDLSPNVISVIESMVADWGLEDEIEIGPDTRLMGDLEFESIDVVQLAVALEQHFEQTELPFETLFMRGGDYVEDLTVTEIAEFLGQHLK